MSDCVYSFPYGKADALALQYIKLHADDLTTPEQFVDMFDDTYERMKKHMDAKDKESGAKNFSFE